MALHIKGELDTGTLADIETRHSLESIGDEPFDHAAAIEAIGKLLGERRAIMQALDNLYVAEAWYREPYTEVPMGSLRVSCACSNLRGKTGAKYKYLRIKKSVKVQDHSAYCDYCVPKHIPGRFPVEGDKA